MYSSVWKADAEAEREAVPASWEPVPVQNDVAGCETISRPARRILGTAQAALCREKRDGNTVWQGQEWPFCKPVLSALRDCFMEVLFLCAFQTCQGWYWGGREFGGVLEGLYDNAGWDFLSSSR